MCMLLGFSAGKRYELKTALNNFFNRSTRHPDGWGIALYDGREICAVHCKGAGCGI